ncbi:methyl-accepting chemotaxis protein [Bradyrhizobium sp. SSBR45G]|nr:methyl-accepting chemotaxis protein [Bradyrhizobium sp. SSBR45G]GLH87612.1 methyl-accepting chemotaxis protein [Bradyrhizobium sp. SSBR45R]
MRIGTKLAVSSLLSILLVGTLIYVQMTGDAAVRAANDIADRQNVILQDAIEAKAAVRGMQIGIRDIRLAKTEAELKAGSDYMSARLKSTLDLADQIQKAATLDETRQRAAKIKELASDYVTKARGALKDKAEAIEIEAKRDGGGLSTEALAKVAKLNEDAEHIAKDVTLPIARELTEVSDRILELAHNKLEHEKQVAEQERTAAERNSLILGATVALLLIFTCVFSIATIARPIAALTRSMLELAEGNFAVVLPGLGRKDEIGDVAGAVEKFKVVSERKAREEAEAKTQQDRVAAEQRKADMHKLANGFEAAVGEIVHTVSSAATELEASASTLTTTATRSQELTATVAAASEQATTNVQSVASATEELSSSVNEISRQVQESARMANAAVDQARRTNERVAELAKAASRIGDVVELINTIAGQTNLLALNATIEAARAGEAGRGFAVVASEVKALAEQTAKATGEIGQQINGIQSATDESVGAIKEISTTIERLSEISSTIAAAVEEQGAATQEISRNVQQAAQGTQQVSESVMAVQRGATETGSASSQVLSAAQTLSTDSDRLKIEVSKFLDRVRAA